MLQECLGIASLWSHQPCQNILAILLFYPSTIPARECFGSEVARIVSFLLPGYKGTCDDHGNIWNTREPSIWIGVAYTNQRKPSSSYRVDRVVSIQRDWYKTRISVGSHGNRHGLIVQWSYFADNTVVVAPGNGVMSKLKYVEQYCYSKLQYVELEYIHTFPRPLEGPAIQSEL